jgi:hypothetical protein
VIRYGELSSLVVVHDHFLQLELPAVLWTERQTALPGERVGVEVGEHPVGGEVEVPGEGGGGHRFSARLNSLTGGAGVSYPD